MLIDLKKVLKASLLISVIGIALVILSVIIRLVATIVTGPEADILTLASAAYSYLMIPIFFLLFFWAGIRAVKKYKLDAVGAGATSAFAFFFVGIIHLVLETLISFLFVGGVIGGGGFIPAEATLAAIVFGESAAGGVGLGLSTVCGFGLIAGGTLINFAVGGFGGLFAQR